MATVKETAIVVTGFFELAFFAVIGVIVAANYDAKGGTLNYTLLFLNIGHLALFGMKFGVPVVSSSKYIYVFIGFIVTALDVWSVVSRFIDGLTTDLEEIFFLIASIVFTITAVVFLLISISYFGGGKEWKLVSKTRMSTSRKRRSSEEGSSVFSDDINF